MLPHPGWTGDEFMIYTAASHQGAINTFQLSFLAFIFFSLTRHLQLGPEKSTTISTLFARCCYRSIFFCATLKTNADPSDLSDWVLTVSPLVHSNCPCSLAAALARATADSLLQTDLSIHHLNKTEEDGADPLPRESPRVPRHTFLSLSLHLTRTHRHTHIHKLGLSTFLRPTHTHWLVTTRALSQFFPAELHLVVFDHWRAESKPNNRQSALSQDAPQQPRAI